MRLVFCLLLALVASLPAAAQDALVLSPRVGPTLDAGEIAYFGLFPLISGARHGEGHRAQEGVELTVHFAGAASGQVYTYHLTDAEWNALGAYIDRYEQMDGRPVGVRSDLVGATRPAFPSLVLTLDGGARVGGRVVYVDDERTILGAGVGPAGAASAFTAVPTPRVRHVQKRRSGGWAPAAVSAVAAGAGIAYGAATDGPLGIAAGGAISAAAWLAHRLWEGHEAPVAIAADARRTIAAAAGPGATASAPPPGAPPVMVASPSATRGRPRYYASVGAGHSASVEHRFDGVSLRQVYASGGPVYGDLRLTSPRPPSRLTVELGAGLVGRLGAAVQGTRASATYPELGLERSDLHVRAFVTGTLFERMAGPLPLARLRLGAGPALWRPDIRREFSLSASVASYIPDGVSPEVDVSWSATRIGAAGLLEAELWTSARTAVALRVTAAALPPMVLEDRAVETTRRVWNSVTRRWDDVPIDLYRTGGMDVKAPGVGFELHYRIYL